MEFIIGIDSGGTNYRVKACNLQGRELGYAVGKPANHHYLNSEELLRQIEENIDNCLAQFGGSRKDLRCIVCGTTGIDSDEDAQRLQICYNRLRDIHCPVRLLNDAELAHYTVTGGQGVLVISGTGSIAFGVNKEGKRARAGGWPLAILGDEGSGTWVSKMALRHMGRWLDGAVEESPLVRLIRENFHINTRDDLIQIALKSGINPANLPQLGRLVNQAAQEGDSHAHSILKGAGEETYHLIEDIVQALGLEENEPDFCIGLWGSNILKSEIVQEQFRKLVYRSYPQARICLPEKEAVDGAVEMALNVVL